MSTVQGLGETEPQLIIVKSLSVGEIHLIWCYNFLQKKLGGKNSVVFVPGENSNCLLFTIIRMRTETNVRRTNYKDVLVYVHKYAGKDRGNYWNSNLNYAQRECGPFFFRIIKYPPGQLIPVRNEPLVHWKLTLEYTRALYIYIYWWTGGGGKRAGGDAYLF